MTILKLQSPAVLLKAQYDTHHQKIDLKVFVVVIPKEGWALVAAPILLLI